MPSVDLETFLREYSQAVNRGHAALFAGAGLSRASGFLDWQELLADIARDVGLSIERETDLPAVAQYNFNKNRTRAAINTAIVDNFAAKAEPSESLHILARLPISTYWTTNYDTLIEDALRDAGRRPDVKRRPENLATSLRGADATVYKMHGDVTAPEQAIITKEDYETYDSTRALFTSALQGDIVEKTFLFLGLSFTDPNIESVLARIRRLLGENQRRHYVILRRPQGVGKANEDFEYETHRFRLRVDDLRRYSIYPVLVDSFEEIPHILRELDRLNRATRVVISGAAHDFSPLGEERVVSLCRSLGTRLVSEGYTLVSGYGLGLAGAVILGAAEAFETHRSTVRMEQLRYRPFPQEFPAGTDRKAFYTNYRREMLADVGIAIFVCGNRVAEGTSDTEISPGVLEEFDLVVEQHSLPIPIGATGHAAREVWKKVSASPTKYLGSLDVDPELGVLGDINASNGELLEAIFRIISMARRPRPQSLP